MSETDYKLAYACKGLSFWCEVTALRFPESVKGLHNRDLYQWLDYHPKIRVVTYHPSSPGVAALHVFCIGETQFYLQLEVSLKLYKGSEAQEIATFYPGDRYWFPALLQFLFSEETSRDSISPGNVSRESKSGPLVERRGGLFLKELQGNQELEERFKFLELFQGKLIPEIKENTKVTTELTVCLARTNQRSVQNESRVGDLEDRLLELEREVEFRHRQRKQEIEQLKPVEPLPFFGRDRNRVAVAALALGGTALMLLTLCLTKGSLGGWHPALVDATGISLAGLTFANFLGFLLFVTRK